MFKRVVVMTAALATLVPMSAFAQRRPTTPPARRPAAAPQRPAARPAATGTAQRAGAVVFTLQGVGFIERDEALFGLLDNTLTPTEAPDRYVPGAVGALGYQVTPKVAVGAGAGYGFTAGLTMLQPFAGLTYTLNPDRNLSPYVLIAGQASLFSGEGSSKATGIGASGALGIRRFVGEQLAVRVEGRVGYENYSDENFNAIVGSAGIGLAYFMGGGPPRDTDGDGVPDNRDRCANTPRGATVDARGCPVDSDRDAVPDGLDRCANTPSGVRVDANGCPRDSDGDGVTDNLDRCPNSPAGTPVDASGCPRDSDGDGVADNLDRCPNTAPGTQVDANGCPVQRDTDGDGVIDANDRCANTPRGARVDSAGCPLAELPAAVGEAIVLRAVLFRSGTATLLPAAEVALDAIATAIVATPEGRFEVGGHSDALGNPAINQRLSQTRAESVRDYLVSKGVPTDRLTAVGYGSSRPVASNATAAGRAQNRRVELKRTP